MLLFVLGFSVHAQAGYQCDGQVDNCSCGMTDPYPCCGSNGNCTWWAWRAACCHWNYAMPSPWQHAKYWAGNYASHPDFKVTGTATKNCVACSTDGDYGHVAFVEDINGGSMRITEMACWGFYGLKDHWVGIPYGFEKFICLKSQMGPFCGDGKCNGSENCKSCQKDCGNCCGNGKCDNGETCSSCEKDCGPCNKAPKGEVTGATCSLIQGWALDPDVDGAIEVVVRIDGVDVVKVKANQPAEGHGDHGFSVPFPDEAKDGEGHTVTVIGKDDKGTKDTAIAGSGAQVLCKSGREFRGIWDVTWTEAAGIDILPVPGDGQGAALKLNHGGNLPYPLSGQVQAVAQLGLTPVERLVFEVYGGFSGGPYALAMHRGKEEADDLASLKGDGESLEWDLELATLSFRVEALKQVVDVQERWLQPTRIRTFGDGWWNDYSHDAAGIIWAHDGLDSVRLQSRDLADAAFGWVGSSLELPLPFDGLLFTADSKLANGLQGEVLVDGDVVHTLSPGGVSGKVVLEGVPGTRAQFRLIAHEKVPLASAVQVIFGGVRVFRQQESFVSPWTLVADHAWGLEAAVPAEGTDGLTVTARTRPEDGFFTTGAVLAEIAFDDPPFDRVRGVMQHSLPGAPFSAKLVVDGKSARELTAQGEQGPFELAADGHRFGLSLGVKQGLPVGPEAAMTLSALSFRRAGWWSSPSADCAGVRDGRLEAGCGVTFENLRWWGMEGKQATGGIQVLKRFDAPIRGVRFKLDSTVEGGLERLLITADGKPVKTFSMLIPGTSEESWQGDSFHELGFVYSVAQPGIYPYRWGAELSEIEVLLASGGWVGACEVAESKDWSGHSFSLYEDILTADSVSLADPDDRDGDRSGGCALGGRPTLLGLVALLLACFLLVGIARTRRNP